MENFYIIRYLIFYLQDKLVGKNFIFAGTNIMKH